MKCPQCHQNGISPLRKLGLIFGLEVRCCKCSAQFESATMQSWLITIGLHGAIWLGILYAFSYHSIVAAYLGAVLGYVLMALVALLSPLSPAHSANRSIRRRRRFK